PAPRRPPAPRQAPGGPPPQPPGAGPGPGPRAADPYGPTVRTRAPQERITEPVRGPGPHA
ncbi:hypothetical protein, partial [Pseudonocardia sulfidoxydans]